MEMEIPNKGIKIWPKAVRSSGCGATEATISSGSKNASGIAMKTMKRVAIETTTGAR
jgi:hypothetical protein